MTGLQHIFSVWSKTVSQVNISETVYLGSETETETETEKDRQTAFYSPLIVDICLFVYQIDTINISEIYQYFISISPVFYIDIWGGGLWLNTA